MNGRLHESERVQVDLGGRLLARCVVARTTTEQARGLQGHSGLGPGDGMLFPFSPARAATFHMGTVSFPIDIVFADAGGRIGRIVHGAQPGSRSRWSHPVCGAVVELQGGACSLYGVEPGQHIRVAVSRHQAQTYNLLRTLVEADGYGPGYYSEEPVHPGGVDTPRTPPLEERWKNRKLPDEGDPNAMDQPQEGWVQQIGYQPTEELAEQGIGPNVRMTAQTVEDPGNLVAGLVEAMARQQSAGRAPIYWVEDPLSGGTTETAIVTPRDVHDWLSHLGLGRMGHQEVEQAVVSPDGLTVLGDGLVLAGLADKAEVERDYLVLQRGIRK